MTGKTLRLVLISSRLTLLELSWKFDRSFCRDNASDFELIVLKILLSSANVAILSWSRHWIDDSHTEGTVVDQGWIIRHSRSI